jgi:hypothetical protein
MFPDLKHLSEGEVHRSKKSTENASLWQFVRALLLHVPDGYVPARPSAVPAVGPRCEGGLLNCSFGSKTMPQCFSRHASATAANSRISGSMHVSQAAGPRFEQVVSHLLTAARSFFTAGRAHRLSAFLEQDLEGLASISAGLVSGEDDRTIPMDPVPITRLNHVLPAATPISLSSVRRAVPRANVRLSPSIHASPATPLTPRLLVARSICAHVVSVNPAGNGDPF